MSKEDLIKQLKEECSSQGIEIKKTDLNKIYDLFMQIIRDDLQKGPIRLNGIGTFYTAISQEKQCRNPQNGEPMTVPQKTRVKFKVSPTLSDILNGKKRGS